MGWTGAPPPFFPSSEHTALDRTKISEVFPRLYLTNFRGAEDAMALKRLNVTHVASVGTEFVDDTPIQGITYWNRDISDDDAERETMAKSLHDAAKFIHTAVSKKKGGSVLVHCAAGSTHAGPPTRLVALSMCLARSSDATESQRGQFHEARRWCSGILPTEPEDEEP